VTRGFSSSSDNWKHIFGKEVLFEERDSATFGNVRTDCRHSVTPFDYFPSPLLQISSSFASKENSRVIKSEGFFLVLSYYYFPLSVLKEAWILLRVRIIIRFFQLEHVNQSTNVRIIVLS
jgi:hypothetical protein